MQVNEKEEEYYFNIVLSLEYDEGYIDTTISLHINKKLSSIRYNINNKIKELNDKIYILNNKIDYLKDTIEKLNKNLLNNNNNKAI